MKEIVSLFGTIIHSAHFDIEKASDQKIVERCELLFVDSSRLVAYESRTGNKFKYSYQWMDKNNQTIYRWDNATHFPQFDTYPYHRHVGSDEQAESYSVMTFHEVLQFIAVYSAS